VSAGVRNWTASRMATAEVSGSVRGSTAVRPRMAAGWPCRPDTDHPTPTSSWPSSPMATLPDHCVRQPARHATDMTAVSAQDDHVSAVVSRRAVLVRTPVQGVRWQRTPSMSTDTSLAACAGQRPSGRRSFRKQRTVNPPIALCQASPEPAHRRSLRLVTTSSTLPQGRPRPAGLNPGIVDGRKAKTTEDARHGSYRRDTY
jgi:hypothetical protein